MAQGLLASQIADLRARIDALSKVADGGGAPTAEAINGLRRALEKLSASKPTADIPTHERAPNDAAKVQQANNWLRRLAWLPIPVLLVAMAGLCAANLPGSYGSNWLIMALNFVFTTLASGLIILLVSRSFLTRGTPGLLLLGCGVLTWGAAGLLAKVVYPRDANLDVTIHNSCVWLSALFHFAGALLLLRPRRALHPRGFWLGAAYAGAFGILGLLVLSALHGYTPTFFVQGAGGTTVRQWVLGSAIAMFLLTAGLLKWSSRRPLSAFLYWYILALCLIALGLLGIMIESVFASPLSWVGLTAQYLSGVYMLIAAIASVRESGAWHISLEAALRQSEERFRLMVENVKDYAIFMLDPEGRVTNWNAGAQHIKGYAAEEIVGQNFSRFYPPEDVAAGKPQRELAIAREQGQYVEEACMIPRRYRRSWSGGRHPSPPASRST